MAIATTKYQDEVSGSKNNAGTSATRLSLGGAALNLAGTNVHFQNHGHVWEAGDAVNLFDQEDAGDATLGVYEITAATDDDLTITPSAGNTAEQLIWCNVGGPWPVGHPAIATGTGNMSQSFGLSERWTLVRVACHFTSGTGKADLVFSLDSVLGSKYDTTLYDFVGRGTGKDALFRLGTTETGAPSAWGFEEGDVVNFAWTNPASGTMEWGLAVSMIPTRLLESWNG